MKGVEFDIVGCKKGGIFSKDKYFIIEYKIKVRLIPADVKKFAGSYQLYINEKGLDSANVRGFLFYNYWIIS